MARNLPAGGTTRINFGNPTSLDITGDQLTMMFWVKRASSSTNRFMALAKRNNSGDNAYDFKWQPTPNGNTLRFCLDTGSGIVCHNSSAAHTETGSWHHVAATYDGSNKRMYFDGVEDANTPAESGNIISVAEPLLLGANDDTSPGDESDGDYAEVAVWAARLTAAEIAAIASGAVAPWQVRYSDLRGYWPLWGTHATEIDLSPHQNGGTLVGSPARATHAPVAPFQSLRHMFNLEVESLFTVEQSKATSTGTNDAAITATLDSSPTVGNVLVAIWANRGNNAAGYPTMPAGWERMALVRGEPNIAMFVKEVEAGEATGVTVTHESGTDRQCLQVLEISGADIQSIRAAAADSAPPSASVTSKTAGTATDARIAAKVFAVAGMAIRDTPGTSGGWTNGFSEVAQVGDGSSQVHLAVSTSEVPSGTIETTRSWATARNAVGALLLIREAQTRSGVQSRLLPRQFLDFGSSLNAMANGAAAGCAAIDNTSDAAQQAYIGGKLQVGTSPTDNAQIRLYAVGSNDNAFWDDNYSGASGSHTLTANARQLKTLLVDSTTDKIYEFGGIDLAKAFGGRVPRYWAIIVENRTGQAFESLAAADVRDGFELHYQPVVRQRN